MSLPITEGSYSVLWDREHSFKLHKKRLEEIKNKNSHRANQANYNLKQHSRLKEKARAFLEQEKNDEIAKQNLRILEKLNAIKLGKSNKLSLSSKDLADFKSLNSTRRKKEVERISYENEMLVKRLSEKPSNVSYQRFEDDYERSVKYKNTISKTKLHEKLKKIAKFEGRYNHLPPLEEDKNETKNRESKSGSPSALPKDRVKKKNLSMTERIPGKRIEKENKSVIRSNLQSISHSDKEVIKEENRKVAEENKNSEARNSASIENLKKSKTPESVSKSPNIDSQKSLENKRKTPTESEALILSKESSKDKIDHLRKKLEEKKSSFSQLKKEENVVKENEIGSFNEREKELEKPHTPEQEEGEEIDEDIEI
ncbi:unnamed protein product [Blepharisma stoltei]|uniref:Uncharacterized protein n=1 Tax=Blepharisma stoltei TaxID=1481888 RepID=A0AAU9IDR0_9CILI|nr:unnamed protein product [Blepharisma stoltei]